MKCILSVCLNCKHKGGTKVTKGIGERDVYLLLCILCVLSSSTLWLNVSVLFILFFDKLRDYPSTNSGSTHFYHHFIP